MRGGGGAGGRILILEEWVSLRGWEGAEQGGEVGKLTHLLVFVEAEETEVEIVHTCVCEKGDGFGGTA